MASVQVVTIGEAMIRLTPVDHQRLETTPLLEVHIGGAELNVAVALAQLGVPVAWVSNCRITRWEEGLSKRLKGSALIHLASSGHRKVGSGFTFTRKGRHQDQASSFTTDAIRQSTPLRLTNLIGTSSDKRKSCT